MRLLLKNLRLWSRHADRSGDLRISRGRVVESDRGLRPRRGERVFDGRGVLALPGLVNCHDHLGLDLLGRLGKPPYSNFYQWARDIYRPDQSPIVDVQAVPRDDRLVWGGYRNLISGVTTVAHHDPPYRTLFTRRFPVRVVKKYGWSHSLGVGEDPKSEFRRSAARGLFMIHAAEGTDRVATAEIDQLDDDSMLGPSTVLIHAVAATSRQIERLAATGTSVVWCPASNLWLYNQTLDLGLIRQYGVPVGLGTDSTLSGAPTLFDELRIAADTGLASPDELLAMITTQAAQVLGITDGRGTLEVGVPADVTLVAEDRGERASASLLAASSSSLAMVMIAGRPRLLRQDFLDQFRRLEANILLDGEPFWLAGNIGQLRARIRRRVGSTEVLDSNPIWNRLVGNESGTS